MVWPSMVWLLLKLSDKREHAEEWSTACETLRKSPHGGEKYNSSPTARDGEATSTFLVCIYYTEPYRPRVLVQVYYTGCWCKCTTQGVGAGVLHGVGASVLHRVLVQVYYTGCWCKCTTQGVGASVLHRVLVQVYYTGCWCKCTTQGVGASVLHRVLVQVYYTGCWCKCATQGVGASVLHRVLVQVCYTGCWCTGCWCKCATQGVGTQGVGASVSVNTLLHWVMVWRSNPPV